MSDRYRVRKRELELLLQTPAPGADDPLAAGREFLDDRTRAITPLIEELSLLEKRGMLDQPLMGIVPSIAHMHVNRVLTAVVGGQETALYHFLLRQYESRLARKRPRL